MHKYDAIVTKVLGTSEITESKHSLFQLAWDLDSLRTRLKDGAQRMAEKFVTYAREFEDMTIRQPPTSWSTLPEMTRDQAAYEAKLDAFKSFFVSVTGRRLRDVIAELDEEAENLRQSPSEEASCSK